MQSGERAFKGSHNVDVWRGVSLQSLCGGGTGGLTSLTFGFDVVLLILNVPALREDPVR